MDSVRTNLVSINSINELEFLQWPVSFLLEQVIFLCCLHLFVNHSKSFELHKFCKYYYLLYYGADCLS